MPNVNSSLGHLLNYTIICKGAFRLRFCSIWLMITTISMLLLISPYDLKVEWTTLNSFNLILFISSILWELVVARWLFEAVGGVVWRIVRRLFDFSHVYHWAFLIQLWHFYVEIFKVLLMYQFKRLFAALWDRFELSPWELKLHLYLRVTTRLLNDSSSVFHEPLQALIKAYEMIAASWFNYMNWQLLLFIKFCYLFVFFQINMNVLVKQFV